MCKRLNSPYLRTGLKLLISIACIELLIMVIFRLIGLRTWMPPFTLDLTDALILSIAASVLIFSWVVNPMKIAEESKKAEDDIRRLLRRNELVLKSAGEGIYGVDLDGRTTFINRAAAEMIGREEGEVIGKRQHDILHHSKPDGTPYPLEACPIYAAFKDGSVHHVKDEVFWRKDGTSFPVEYTSTPMGEDGNLVGAVVVFRDITGQKRAEGELRDAFKRVEDEKAKTEAIIAAIGDGISIQDRDFRILYQNQIATDLIGNHVGEYCYMAYEGMEHICERCAVAMSFKDGKIHTVVRSVITDKGMKYFEITASVVRDSGGNIIAGIEVVRDITERKRIEEALLLTQHDWEDTFNAITDMITVHDKDFNIVRANKAAEKLLGLPLLEKIPDTKCFQYYHGTEKPPEGCPSCSCLQTGMPAAFEIFEPHLKMFIEIRAIPRFDSDGRLIGLIHVVRDISERKKTEDRIQRQVQKLSALRSIDLAISSNLDIRVTLKILIDHVILELGVDAVNVLLLNSREGTLEYGAGQGFRTNALRHTRLRLGEGYAGVAAIENRIVHIKNLKNEDGSGFTRGGLIEGEDFITYYGVPLVAKGRVKGVLEILHRSPLEPDAEWIEFLEALALQAAIAIDNVSLFNELQRANLDLVLAYDRTIEGWSHALDYRDKETEGHSQRVTELTIVIAREMGLDEEGLVHVRRGALLHDIGKMGIPDGILFKPGSLTEDEWKIMRLHPVYAYELLRPIDYLRPALDIPYCHHEKWDGTGYPRRLKGEEIPLAARIFAVVDVWDALRSDRPYRPAWSEEKTMEYLRTNSGSHFDPEVVEMFISALAHRRK